MITPKEIHWLAGLLEGEGCFRWKRLKHGGTPRITLAMCDQDIVERAAQLLNSSVYFRDRIKYGANNKRQWITEAVGPNAIGWMQTLYTDLGIRRRTKIREILMLWRGAPGRGHRKGKLFPGQGYKCWETRRKNLPGPSFMYGKDKIK